MYLIIWMAGMVAIWTGSQLLWKRTKFVDRVIGPALEWADERKFHTAFVFFYGLVVMLGPPGLICYGLNFLVFHAGFNSAEFGAEVRRSAMAWAETNDRPLWAECQPVSGRTSHATCVVRGGDAGATWLTCDADGSCEEYKP